MIWIEYRSVLTGQKVLLKYEDLEVARRAMKYAGVQDWKVIQDSEDPGRPPRKAGAAMKGDAK